MFNYWLCSLFSDSSVAWKFKKQGTISRSSSECEYRAIISATSEVTWTVRLLEEFGIYNLKLITLHYDNQSIIYIFKNHVFHVSTKHIEIECHFTRDKFLKSLIQFIYLATQHQSADLFTKILPSTHFNSLLSKLGMFHSTYSNLRGNVTT